MLCLDCIRTRLVAGLFCGIVEIVWQTQSHVCNESFSRNILMADWEQVVWTLHGR